MKAPLHRSSFIVPNPGDRPMPRDVDHPPPVDKSAAAPLGHALELPDWYPAWTRELADRYFSGTTCMFVLHGNVHDLIAYPDGEQTGYCNLPEFLATQLFGSWEVVLNYDLARGLRPLAGSNPRRLQAMVQHVAARLGEPVSWPRDPENLLLALDRFIERSLLEEDPAHRKSVSVILDYGQYLVPSGDLGTLARGQSTNLVRLLGWA